MLRTLAILIWMSCTLSATAADKYQTQLRRECDALAEIALRRGYGVGFDPSGRPDTRKPTTRPVSLEPLQTPAAGCALLWAGQFLNEPRYIELSNQIAKATALGQTPTGMFPAYVIFQSKPQSRDEPLPVPERAATLASLGLLLSAMNATPDPAVKSAAQRASHWLLKQRTNQGLWPSLVATEDSAKNPLRMIRTELPDQRNCILSLLLAGEVLNEADLTAAAVKALDYLLTLRVTAAKTDRPMFWVGAYEMSGNVNPGKAGLPDSIDLLATRYAMQSLLAGYVMVGDRKYGQACDDIAKLLPEMTMREEMWRRFPDARESSQPPSIFGVASATEFGALGLPPVLDSINQLKRIGRDQYKQMLSTQFAPHQHLAATLVGFRDQPLMIDLPVSRGEIEPYLKLNAGRFAVLDAPIPEPLSERTQRLWLLLIRAKLEQLSN